jgi:hypothetical protein
MYICKKRKIRLTLRLRAVEIDVGARVVGRAPGRIIGSAGV